MDSWLYLWLFVWLSSPEDLLVVLLGSVQDSFYVDTFGFMTCCGNVPSLSDFFSSLLLIALRDYDPLKLRSLFPISDVTPFGLRIALWSWDYDPLICCLAAGS